MLPTALAAAVLALVTGTLGFRTVAHGAPAGAGPAVPRVYLAATRVELSRFLGLLAAPDQARVRAVSFPAAVELAVFRGQVPTGGYSITVKRLTLSNRRLRIVAAFGAPGPGDIVIQVFTSPYHVVRLVRSALGSRLPTAWSLLDTKGELVASGAFR